MYIYKSDYANNHRLDRSVVVGGVSLGGYIVMSMLRRYPSRIAAVVLADTRRPRTLPMRRRTAIEADRVLNDGSTQVLVDEFVPCLVGTTTHAQRPTCSGD